MNKNLLNIDYENLGAMLQHITLRSLIPAIIYAVVGLFAIKFMMRLIKRALVKSKIDRTLHKFILTITKLLLYFSLFLIVADALGVQITSFVALLSVAGLAVSLSLQGFLGNIASGVSILTEAQIRVGEEVLIGDVEGVVREIGISHTKINSWDNKVIFIPNTEITSSKITNYSRESMRRVDLTLSLGYGYDINLVRHAMLEMISEMPTALNDPKPFVRVTHYGSTVDYAVRAWCKTEDYWTLYFDMLEAIPAACQKYGIVLTAPQQAVRLVENKK